MLHIPYLVTFILCSSPPCKSQWFSFSREGQIQSIWIRM